MAGSAARSPAEEFLMKELHVTLPELILVAGTRVTLGAGLGLVLADRLPREQRKAVGWTLFLIGVLTTIPLALEVFGGRAPRSNAPTSGLELPDRESARVDSERLAQWTVPSGT